MRRPLCCAAMLFALLIGISVILFPEREPFPKGADRRKVVLTGKVQWKEYKIQTGPDGDEKLLLQITLQDVTIERGLPAHLCAPIYRRDRVLCVLDEDLEGRDKAAGIGCRIRISGSISLFASPTCDGVFDSLFYYHAVQGYLFRLNDAQLLAASLSGSIIPNTLYRIREVLSDAIDHLYLSDGKASVMKAVLLGQTGLLDPDVRDMYQANGLIHIVCISGLHISLMGMGLFRLLRKAGLPAAVCAGVSVTVIILYGTMTGMHASSFRAVLMFVFHITAMMIGRTYDLLTALSAAAVLLLIDQPMYIAYSGFQYSFAAVIAIGAYSEYLPRRWRILSVPLFVLPVQLWHNYTFPIYSIPLNLVVIPLMTVVMVLGLSSLLLFFLPGFTGAAALTARGVSAVLGLYQALCSRAETLPCHTIIAGRPMPSLIVLYFVILAAAGAVRAWSGMSVPGRGDSGQGRREISMIGRLSVYKTAAVQLCMIAAAAGMLLFVRITPKAALYMLDVGQGDGLYIECGDLFHRTRILIDGGSSDKMSLGKYTLGPFLKYHGAGTIDMAILTHDDYDHCSGLVQLIENTKQVGAPEIRTLVLPDISRSRAGDEYRHVEESARERDIPVIYLHRGQGFELGGLTLMCLHPEEDAVYRESNEYSLTIMARYRDFSALLTGDLEGEGEKELLRYWRKLTGAADPCHVTLLKTAHHGSAGATSDAFLSVFEPSAALISCGLRNRYGHPSPEVISRLTHKKAVIYDTRTDGQITAYIHNKKLYVRTYCGKQIRTFNPESSQKELHPHR